MTSIAHDTTSRAGAELPPPSGGPRPLTARQRAILDFIREASAAAGVAPTLVEIGQRFGIGRVGVWQHLKALEAKGWIIREKYHARGIVVAADGAAPGEVKRLRERLAAAEREIGELQKRLAADERGSTRTDQAEAIPGAEGKTC